MIQPAVHSAEVILLHWRQHDAVYMGTGIALRNVSSHALMENPVGDALNASILIQPHHRHPAVVIAPHKKILISVVHLHITAAHASDPGLIQRFQISVRKNPECLHSLVRNRIQEFSIL